MMQNLKRNWFVVLKLTRGIWEILTRALESLKNLHFNGLLLKYIMFELKKYRGVMFHDTEKWCKIWRKTDLWFGKWHEEFGKFSPEHSKISKICTLMGCFWPKYIIFELKKYRGVMFDSTEDWCKMWRKTDLYFQKWYEEFGKFSQTEKYTISF